MKKTEALRKALEMNKGIGVIVCSDSINDVEFIPLKRPPLPEDPIVCVTPLVNHLVEDFKYCHLTKKEREAIIVPIRDSSKTPKVGRNKPCPCGSGKKYKKCCGLK